MANLSIINHRAKAYCNKQNSNLYKEVKMCLFYFLKLNTLKQKKVRCHQALLFF